MKNLPLPFPFPRLFLCFILLAAPCLASGQTNKASVAAPASPAIFVTPDIDSTFAHNYISKEPEFKQHLALVHTFYQDRSYFFAWIKNDKLVPQADKLLQAIDNAHKEGLNSKDYKVKDLGQLTQSFQLLSSADPRRKQLQQEIDLALTASYFNYASDFYKGTVDPHSASAIEWEVKRNKVKLNKALETILQERESSYPYYEFEALHPGYKQLRDALVQYRALQEKGGWPQVEPQGLVQLDDTAKVVVALRKRLLPKQQVNEQDSAFMVYDQQVKEAVVSFQRQHGLTPDGIVGPKTYEILNIPVQDRIEQIVLNMERWRWLPKRLTEKGKPDRYVMVNIPAFRVTVMENGKEAMRMKAVVGKTMHATPVFSHQIQYLMFSPYWNVPNSIVESEIKPKLQRNSNWLASQNMEMVTTFGPDAQQVPVSRVNWYSMNAQNFKYRIRQKPGPKNSLGKVKFMFPNEYAVYLHDTPADHLFSEADRDFSHGCVRVERPADLATYLLRNKPGWDRSRVVNAMNATQQQRVDLPQNVPVYLVYFTTWVEKDGTVHFRDDLYSHDKALAQLYY